MKIFIVIDKNIYIYLEEKFTIATRFNSHTTNGHKYRIIKHNFFEWIEVA